MIVGQDKRKITVYTYYVFDGERRHKLRNTQF